MIHGVGIDHIEIERVQRKIEDDGFIKKVFADCEIAYCNHQGRPAQHFAARFAAKEAFFKAMGTGWQGGMEFYEIAVAHDGQGCPIIVLSGRTKELFEAAGGRHIHVSLTHIQLMASAVVIIEK